MIDISILLPCYKSEKLLEHVFIPSLKNWKCNYEVILYDNGGNGNLKKYESYRIKIVGNGENVGLNKALNECAKIAKGKYFYLPHTDMYLLPSSDHWLLIEAKKHVPHTFLFCSRSVEPTRGHTPFQKIVNYGQEYNEFDEQKLLEDFKNYNDNSIVTSYRMPFFGHTNLLEKLEHYNKKNNICYGPFDEKYFSYCTDDDFFVNVYHLGIRKFWMINNSLVYHLQGKSNNQQKIDKDCNKPYEHFREKWSKVGYNSYQHIDQFVQSLIPWNIKIK